MLVEIRVIPGESCGILNAEVLRTIASLAYNYIHRVSGAFSAAHSLAILPSMASPANRVHRRYGPRKIVGTGYDGESDSSASSFSAKVSANGRLTYGTLCQAECTGPINYQDSTYQWISLSSQGLSNILSIPFEAQLQLVLPGIAARGNLMIFEHGVLQTMGSFPLQLERRRWSSST